MSKATIKGILPCAGYGTRMSMKPNESKEMLRDPNFDGYLIDYSLNLCYANGIEPVIISRIEKEDLNSYLRSKNVEHIVLKEPGREWADTVLKSQGLWLERNVLILPDTRFDDDAVSKLIDNLTWNHNSDVVAAVHEIKEEDTHKWGAFTNQAIYEKLTVESNAAWGLLAWNGPYAGNELFSEIKNNNVYRQYENIPFIKLNKFIDITRTGKLEY